MQEYRRIQSSAITILLTGLALSCGNSAEDQAKTYILNEGRISDVVTIWGQTLAVSGRHATIADGLNLASTGPTCMGGDTEGTVSVAIVGCENTDDGIQCLLPETYDCNYVQGSIAGSIVSSDTAMTVSLASTSYTEGSVALLGVELLYDGHITITTTANAARVDQALNLTVSDSVGATLYNNRAYWDVVQDGDLVLFNGAFTLPTELGDLTLESTDLAFQPGVTCAGPVSGRFDMRFGSSEHARILVEGCGTATLQYINTNDDSIVETELDLPPDVLRGAFSLSAADIGGFMGSPGNLSQHAGLVSADEIQIWCRLFESDTDLPLFAVDATLGARANPVPGSAVAECLITAPSTGGPKFIAGNVAFTQGFDGDLTPIKILSAATGSVSVATDGSVEELVFEKYGDAAYIGDLDHLTAASTWALLGGCSTLVAGCEHLTDDPWHSYASQTTLEITYEFNHFGAWMSTSATSSANYFAVTLPE